MDITVKEFKELLEHHDENLPLTFSGLSFFRLKDRGGDVQVEFNQSVYRDDEGNVVIENH